MFAPVFQDYVLNAFSIRENLIFDYNEREGLIKGALEKTGIYNKLLSSGLTAPTAGDFPRTASSCRAERSSGLSSRAPMQEFRGGRARRATAAIDPLSERKLFQDVFDGIGSTTSIMISHRMSCSKFPVGYCDGARSSRGAGDTQ